VKPSVLLESPMPEYPEEEYGPVPLRLPRALTVVAWLFAAEGALAAMDVLLALSQAQVSLNVGVLCIFVARGLLKLRRGWRTFALVILWLEMILFPVFALCMVAGTGDFSFIGVHVRSPNSAGGAVLVLGLFALTAWEYRVLTRPDVRRLFNLGERERAVLGRVPRILDVALLATFVGFIVGLANGTSSAEGNLFTRLSRYWSGSASHHREQEAFRALESELSWFFRANKGNRTTRGGGVSYAGQTHRDFVIYGPHTLASDDKQFKSFANDFQQRLSSRVEQIIGIRLEVEQGGSSGFPVRLGLGDKWCSTGGFERGAPCATLVATYLRDDARGTAVLHVSMEPNYATLTVVEDVER